MKTHTCPHCRATFPVDECNSRPFAPLDCGIIVTCPKCEQDFEPPVTITPAAAAVRPLKPELADGIECECPNCEWYGDVSKLGEISNLWERVSPGELMPFGECPECGALCHMAQPDAGEAVLAAILKERVQVRLENDRLRAELADEPGEWPKVQTIDSERRCYFGPYDLVGMSCREFSKISLSSAPLQVIVEVQGGVAEVTTCPAGVEVEIIDHDNEKDGGAA